MTSMAPYHIRKYQEGDRERVLALYCLGMREHIPATFRHTLKLPRTHLLSVGVPLTLLLATGSWFLTIASTFLLLVFLWLLANYPWKMIEINCLRTELADITRTYSAPGSCYWVAECGGQVVGTVSALPVADPPPGKKQLQLLHLVVALEHRGKGIAKGLIRTLLQFARVEGYSEVIVETTIMQEKAQVLYRAMGFRETGRVFPTVIWRILAIPVIQLLCCLPSAQDKDL